jgi:hypothetical protein
MGDHPVLIVSNAERCARKKELVVLMGRTMRPGQPFREDALQVTLGPEEGLELPTRFDCDLFYTLDRSQITRKRGEVESHERRANISRKMVQSLALAGL